MRAESSTPAMAEHALLGEAADLECGLGHGSEWIRHHDDDAVGRVLNDLFDDGFDHVVVRFQPGRRGSCRACAKASGDHPMWLLAVPE